jgi:hypothetical protein
VIQEEVPEHAGMLIAQPARTIMTKLVEGLESDITKREWPAAENGYRALIDGCNRCHSATEYGFIQIDPDGSGPFNQKF